MRCPTPSPALPIIPCCPAWIRRPRRSGRSSRSPLSSAARDSLPPICLFGAGHVGKAIVQALAPLPLRLVWIDSRADEFPETIPDGVTRLVAADPLACAALAEPGSGFLILTHEHALDF